ncbi:hypothetical protein BN1012_Phect268 [Candidatus Phaeomarinobacter ectocarpi]|uniref:Uncharacterized protein n=1 Tax=Candidatus Phaeomarinibacter ectocarpi TaxID=1458461 RepID=X5MBS9_9HYPH|nr:hypothetical protein BN1012_Phect268 [Candidatus Phaeomarinobacter ectocarpi]
MDPEEVTAQQLKRLVPDHLHYLELMNKRLDDQQTIFGGGGLLDRDMGFCQSTMDEFKQRALADGNKAGAGVFR